MVDVCATLDLVLHVLRWEFEVLWNGLGTTYCLNLGEQPFVFDCQTLADALEDLYRTSPSLSFSPFHVRFGDTIHGYHDMLYSRELPRPVANLYRILDRHLRVCVPQLRRGGI